MQCSIEDFESKYKDFYFEKSSKARFLDGHGEKKFG